MFLQLKIIIRLEILCILLFIGFTKLVYSQITVAAKIGLPDTIGNADLIMGLPISVSTDSAIGLAQFVVEYDSNVVRFLDANIGPDVEGFVSTINNQLPFKPTTSGTNKNVLVQISGGGFNYFTGSNKKVTILDFNLVGSVNDSTPLVFDQGVNKTFLTTIELIDITADEIFFNHGSLKIQESTYISDLTSRKGFRDFYLYQNYPNPFNLRTVIAYIVPKSYDEEVAFSLKVYNISGKLIRSLSEGTKRVGIYFTEWDGCDEFRQPASSGLYFYTITIGKFRETRKMILIK